MNTASELGAGSDGPSLERLQKVMAAAGVASRRACEELIAAGRVSVDGKVVQDAGMKVNPETQVIEVDAERIQLGRREYYLFNKPKGVLCTNFDPAGRPRVIDFFPKTIARLFTVGRLDENSDGLLLVTNDGELAQRLLHPKFQTSRIYRVLVAGNPTEETLEQLKQGLYFSDGKFRVKDVKRISEQGQSTVLNLLLTEGKNREVRRLLARVGHKVMQLTRISFGPLKLKGLEVGETRRLTAEELKELFAFSSAGGKGRSKSLEEETSDHPTSGRRAGKSAGASTTKYKRHPSEEVRMEQKFGKIAKPKPEPEIPTSGSDRKPRATSPPRKRATTARPASPQSATVSRRSAAKAGRSAAPLGRTARGLADQQKSQGARPIEKKRSISGERLEESSTRIEKGSRAGRTTRAGLGRTQAGDSQRGPAKTGRAEGGRKGSTRPPRKGTKRPGAR